MHQLSRREVLGLGLAASTGLVRGVEPEQTRVTVHQQILELAAKQQARRRASFTAVRSTTDLATLQQKLRRAFLELLDGLPATTGAPHAKTTGRIDGDGYLIEKLVFESFPGYFVSALLYLPRKINAPVPGILAPCGHSPEGKAAVAYQILCFNLVKRGHVVLTYDPVGQGERSQFWDKDKGRSRFNLSCGEHAVLGNPLYLLGTSLARYRIWDGIRGLDYLAARPEVDPQKLGCVGNSGGGTLTAYIAALDKRVQTAVISCYITTLPRRMANRIEEDPDADPEQDVFGFVSEGIDHAGLLALRAPRPTLICAARHDFFPIEGTRESFAEAKKLFEVSGNGDRIAIEEANENHGLTLPLRRETYRWFDRWMLGRTERGAQSDEIPVIPRPASALLVCDSGQVNESFGSRPLLTVALEEFNKKMPRPRLPLMNLLRVDPNLVDYRSTEVVVAQKAKATLVVCVNGNQAGDWRDEKRLLTSVASAGLAVSVVDPRGVGSLKPSLQVKGHDYADPLAGVEENLAYNAFLVGQSLLAMRVADVVVAVRRAAAKAMPSRIILCGRRDAALVACLAAAIAPDVGGVAVEEITLSLLPLFESKGQPINAAGLLPGMLADFGDVPAVLAAIAPRKVLVAGNQVKGKILVPSVQLAARSFTNEPEVLLEWLGH